MYIGQTKSWAKRYYRHNGRRGRLNKCGCGENALMVPFKDIENQQKRNEVEKQLIQFERPMLNKAHNPDYKRPKRNKNCCSSGRRGGKK
jgi:hypothetical protein